jgi:hypothetical protein
MKRYAILIYTDDQLLDEMPPGRFDEDMRGCLAHAEELKRHGTLHDSQMLQHASTARALRVRDGRSVVVDGPFAETKEMLAGFNIVEAEDMDDAVRIASEFPWAAVGCIEVREIMDMNEMRQRVNAPPAEAPVSH